MVLLNRTRFRSTIQKFHRPIKTYLVMVEVESMDSAEAMDIESRCVHCFGAHRVRDFGRRLRESQNPSFVPREVRPILYAASIIGKYVLEAKCDLESLKNINKEGKKAVIRKLAVISELDFHLEESRSKYVAEFARSRAS
ncbi:hypothetical protein EVAR_56948_1 [Eumeta japonica]|uniref:Uncharacterized protein n=1 Tax=Eumeta variegata TaxID=151549 RepID=A0A4C1YQM6_EUMVA|nr:hypothetical protein EVAR_56948_1 [Eumeta japonica]